MAIFTAAAATIAAAIGITGTHAGDADEQPKSPPTDKPGEDSEE